MPILSMSTRRLIGPQLGFHGKYKFNELQDIESLHISAPGLTKETSNKVQNTGILQIQEQVFQYNLHLNGTKIKNDISIGVI